MAIDPNNKFLYFNKDSTSTEMDEALCFPVSSFIGLEIHTSSRLHFFFEGSKGTDATIVRVLHEQYAYQKNFVTALVDEINYGENAFIRVYDHAERLTHPSDITVNMITDIVPTFYTQDTDHDVVSHRYNITSSTDGDYQGDVVYFGTGSSVKGTIYHYKSDGSWEVANANAAATSDGLLAVALGTDPDEDGMLLRGMVTLDHDPGAVGDVLYLSAASNGDATATAPSGNEDIVRIIGYCLHASSGMIWFNPDNTFVEVTA